MAEDGFQIVDVKPVENVSSQLKTLHEQVADELKTLQDERTVLAEERAQLAADRENFTEMLAEGSRLVESLRGKKVAMEKISLTQKEALGKLAVERAQLEKLRLSQDESLGTFKTEFGKLKESLERETASRNKERNQWTRQANEGQRVEQDLRDAQRELAKLKDIRRQQATVLEEMHSELRQISNYKVEVRRQLERLAAIKKKSSAGGSTVISLNDSEAYACKQCGTHIGLESSIESKSYQVGQGAFSEKKRGYLFKSAVNLTLGPIKDETFTTGTYQISWVSCMGCDQQLGWQYVNTDSDSNSVKIGKYCLARYSLSSHADRQK